MSNLPKRPRMPSNSPPASPPAEASAPGTGLHRSAGEAALIRSLAKLDEVLTSLLTDKLPAVLAEALLAALAQAPAEGKGMCAPCQIRRAEWDTANVDAVQFAFAKARQEAGLEAGDPAAADLDVFAYLPAELHPDNTDPLGRTGSLPMSFPAITTFRGTDLCAMHVQEIAQQNVAARLAQAQETAPPVAEQAKRPILVSPPGMNAATAAKIASQGIPNQ